MARLRLEGEARGFLIALPPLGSVLPVRRLTWPVPVRLAHVGDAGVTLLGDPLAPGDLAQELRCGGHPDAGRSVGLAVEVVDAGGGLIVEASFDGPEPLDCELSAVGRRRLERAALDVYLWARSISRTGDSVPAEAR